MATYNPVPPPETRRVEEERLAERRDERTVALMEAGSIGEGAGGAGALVLAILGMAGVFPLRMMAISAMAIGATMILEGLMSVRFTRFYGDVGASVTGQAVQFGGLTIEFLCGCLGFVLGIIGLAGANPQTLVAICALVYGATLCVGSGVSSRHGLLPLPHGRGQEKALQLAHESLIAAAGAQGLVGLAAIILGIVALVGFDQAAMNLTAMLCLSVAALVTAPATGARMLAGFSPK